MASFPHVVIRASAGTGKTYQLSNRYIGLAASGTAAEQILAATFARKAAGEILDRVLTRAGRTIGCEYYPDPDWIVREHLPAVTQPVLQITSVRYADALSAYNAMVRTGTAGGSAHQVSIGTGLIGIAYRARFDPPDGNTDWCYVFSKGVTVVTVKSAQADNELGPESVARAIAPKF